MFAKIIFVLIILWLLLLREYTPIVENTMKNTSMENFPQDAREANPGEPNIHMDGLDGSHPAELTATWILLNPPAS